MIAVYSVILVYIQVCRSIAPPTPVDKFGTEISIHTNSNFECLVGKAIPSAGTPPHTAEQRDRGSGSCVFAQLISMGGAT